MKILGLLGKTTDEGLSGLGRLWDELTGGVKPEQVPQVEAMRTQGYSPEYAGGLLKFGEEGMTQEARMARAAEQGFEGPFYRWTEGGQGRVVRTPEVDTGLKFGPAGYASPQPDYGARYVDPTKSNVQPLMARGPLADLNEVDRVSQGLIAQRKEAGLPQWPGHQQHWAEMQDALKAEGYRGVRYGDKEVASFEPEKNMRSINAVFDPEGKGGLLSGVGGATVLGGGLLGGSEDAEAGVGSKILGQISETGFFSPLERAVGGLSQQKGTGDQMLAMIQKQAGVKPEEVQWTGLGDFLAGKPSVTKSEIEDYLLNNRVELKEVRLGEFSPEQNAVREQAIARYEDIADISADTRAKLEEGVLSSQEARVILEPLYAERDQLRRTIESIGESMTTKFSQYTTPGGSNYRELLMTMPKRKSVQPAESTSGWTVETVSENPYVGQRQIVVRDADGNIRGQRSGFRGTDQEAIDNAVSRMADHQTKEAEAALNFRSSHFDQPNILAHTRVKDYTQDGQKILHVDEVQSDWHQAGRKKGYSDQSVQPQIEEIQAKMSALASQRDPITNRMIDEEKWFELARQKDALIAKTEGVPDAPFKKNWHELMTRRILQEAADKGYSRVTFTTGRTQADRYDLSKQVDSISWGDAGSSKSLTLKGVKGASGKDIEIYLDKDTNKVKFTDFGAPSEWEGKDLADIVGKEVAEKVANSADGSLSGDGLAVGGEGMKGFYDNMMVKAFNKEGKKFGVKVEPYNLKTGKDGEQVWSMEIPPEMRAKKKAEGSPMFAAAPFGLLGAGAMTPDKDAQAAMIAENIRQTPLSAFDLNRKPQAEMRAPRYGLLADIADAFEAGSRNDLLGSGESAARVANALAYGQRPGVLDTIVGSFEAVDPITWASLFGAMSKGR